MGNGSTGGVGRGASGRWTPDEARRALGELTRSRLSTEQFARSKGVSGQRIAYWKKRLASGDADAIAFVSVPLTAPTTGPSEGRSARVTLEIEVRDVILRMHEDIDVERFALLVRALVHGAR